MILIRCYYLFSTIMVLAAQENNFHSNYVLGRESNGYYFTIFSYLLLQVSIVPNDYKLTKICCMTKFDKMECKLKTVERSVKTYKLTIFLF